MIINFKKIGKVPDDEAQKGLSLIETLVVVGLLGLITPIILNFLWGGFVLNSRAAGSIANQRVARQAIDKVSKDLREISRGDNNQYPLVTCDPLEIAFYADYDGDGGAERIRYFVDDAQLKRGIIEPTGSPAMYLEGNEIVRSLINDVLNDEASAMFGYYDGNYTGTEEALAEPVSCPLVRLVDIRFSIDTIVEKQPGAFELASKVSLRNLKNNL